MVALSGSIKELHRRILLSNTYQQSSRWSERAAAEDTENRWLWAGQDDTWLRRARELAAEL